MINASSSLTSATTGSAIPVSPYGSGNAPVGLTLDFTTVAAVGTASVQFTNDDPSSASAVWLPLASLSGKTATINVAETMPMRAVRLVVSAYTSGTITLRVAQGTPV